MGNRTGTDKHREPSRRIKDILAQNVRSFRRVKRLSQEDLAAKCNLHRTYVGSVERGERNVTLSTLEVLADALGITVPRLLTEGSIDNGDEK